MDIVMDLPASLLKTWTVKSFEIRGVKTILDKWADFTFKEDGSVDYCYYNSNKQVVKSSLHKLSYENGVYTIYEGNRKQWTIDKISENELMLVNDLRNMIYHCIVSDKMN